MSDKQPKRKVNSRWARGGNRYDEKTQDLIDKRYREPFGWHRGAKVRPR